MNNNSSKVKILLGEEFNKIFKEKVVNIDKLPAHGSNRIYFRLKSNNKQCIGAYNEDLRENRAFIYLANHFKNKGLNVPKIISEDLQNNIYLLEDLGNTTLFDYLKENRKDKDFPQELFDIYKNVVIELSKLQIKGADGLDFNICYPRHSFDKRSIMWDLNYFKYYFIKFSNIVFDEELLENDYEAFCKLLIEAKHNNYFLYRDFQSRNIMIKDNSLFFIDFQGGRKGAIYYDLASLLYDAKADIPDSIRTELLQHYIKNIQNFINVAQDEFMYYFYAYTLLRIMQALGAYGYRGYYEKKEHFINSIPYALKNLKVLLQKVDLYKQYPELYRILTELTK